MSDGVGLNRLSGQLREAAREIRLLRLQVDDMSTFRDVVTAPRDGTMVEVRHGPDQEVVWA
jgi:hypothetical protein